MSIDAGEFRNLLDLDQANFGRIAGVMRDETGIELPVSKLPLVQARLLRRLRVLHLTSYGAYCDVIENSANEAERLSMVSALTTNVTSFFREMHHFDYIRDNMIPDIARRLRAGEAVRVWSAGCSSGEEPYSLALTLVEVIPDIARYDFKLLATDIDPIVLNSAMQGVYPDAAINGVPEPLRRAHFEPVASSPGLSRIRDTVKNLIAFRRLNLIGNWPIKRMFDIIMCRNVVIYFGEQTKGEIWTRLCNQLAPQGVLFTGHSERLSGLAANRMKLVATTTYRAGSGADEIERTKKCH